ncbi:MAG TPA: HAD family hydrolase [Polyangiaceae bacterium]|nr:HAD family hydrolase [Polyangiaceae bacterium]
MRKDLYVFDIDDTLFDWLTMWVSSFSALLERLEQCTQLPPANIKHRFRCFHQNVGTSEFPFRKDDLLVVVPEAGEVFAEQIAHQLDTQRREWHLLFPGIVDLLKSIKARGKSIALHTDAPPVLAEARTKALGLDVLVDAIYSTADHRLSPRLTASPTGTRHRVLDRKKPTRDALDTIVADLGVNAEQTIYIGDSLYRDIAMAQTCGVLDIYAAYGCNRDGAAYNLLRDVSHWTEADVREEKRLHNEHIVAPTLTALTISDLSRLVEQS